MRHPHGLRAASLGKVTNAWNISEATYNGTPINFFDVSSLGTLIRDVFFKPDGLKMYVATGNGLQGEYNLSVAWDVSTASFVRSYASSSQDAAVTALQFKPDGTKMYTLGDNNNRIYEYNLSTAWALNTVTYSNNSFLIAEDTSPSGLFFKPDGTKVYVTGSVGDSIYEYNLSTAWDISTASFLQSFSVATQESVPTGIFFTSDGTKVYIVGTNGREVNEYTLSTAWDISSATDVGIKSLIPDDSAPHGIFFKDDGTKMFIAGGNSLKIYEYDLSIAYNVSTATYTAPTTNYYVVESQEATPQGLFFKPDGTKFYIIGTSGDDINEYDLSIPWDISTASFLQIKSVSTQENTPNGLFFKSDGTKVYIVGSGQVGLYEYNLSTAWDISTAVFVQKFNSGTEDVIPTGIFFKDDGTKFYISGDQKNAIYEYDLSTAWDISTASFLQSIGVGTQDTTLAGLFFKPDGTKLYTIGGVGSEINEYNLSTPWNISTISFFQVFSLTKQMNAPTDLFFKPDGTKVYVIKSSAQADEIWSYDL